LMLLYIYVHLVVDLQDASRAEPEGTGNLHTTGGFQ
jgi:hypothetical protein